MDITVNDYACLCGSIGGRPRYSHSSRGLEFYTFPLEVERLSGYVDSLNILVRREQLDRLADIGLGKLWLEGELRSYNDRHGSGAKLVISVLAKSLAFCQEPFLNSVELRGTICKPPKLRSTPMGRDICDIMLAVNRRYGRSDYLPCICWGRKAREAAHWQVGDRLELQGRIQSRRYIKMTEEGPLEKTAFEVSANSLERISARLPESAALCD